jgi:hypothetical protein
VTVYADLFRYRELFGSLFRRDLRAKYKGSVLGLAWSLAHPVVLMLVYLLVFSVLLKIRPRTTSTTGSSCSPGMPVWVFFATSLQSSVAQPARERESDPEGALPASARAALDGRDPARRLRVMLAIVIVLSLVYMPDARDTVWLALPVARAVVGFVAGSRSRSRR